MRTLIKWNYYERESHLENIYLSCSRLKSTSWFKNLTQRYEECKYLFMERLYCQTWRFECIKSCQERTFIYLNRYTILCKSWGVERLTLWWQIWYMVFRMCVVWNVRFGTTIPSRRHEWSLQKDFKGIIPTYSKSLLYGT